MDRIVDKLTVVAGRYRLKARLGGGGMSVVWRAYDEVMGRWVAVKVVAPGHADVTMARERIRIEARAAQRVNHSHVRKVLDYSDSGEFPYLVMELLEGQTLAQRLRAGRLPALTALEICAQVADALAAAHASGVVHRDIKPGNVMLTPDGATVLDLGIAAFADESDDSGQAGESDSGRWGRSIPEDRIWATAAYVAPERLTKRRVLPASDVYALGVLLYRALTGRRPWPAAGRAEMLAAHVSAAPEPLPPDIGVPPEVAALCYRCLAKDPRDRPTARDVAIALTAAAAISANPARSLEAGAVTTIASVARVVDHRRLPWRHAATRSGERLRRQLAVVAGTVGLLVATGLSIYAATSDSGSQPTGEAAPRQPGPSASGPYGLPPGSPPFLTAPVAPAMPATPANSPDGGSPTRDPAGQADSLSGSGSVQLASEARSGGNANGSSNGRGAGGGNAPSPKPHPTPNTGPKPKPTPTQTPPTTTAAPSPTTTSSPGVVSAPE
jgi:eukaryotic-like serine/threonine-protein kinase